MFTRSSENSAHRAGWLLGLLILLTAIAGGCATMGNAFLRTVDRVDLPRFMGDWYVIANIPYFAEKDCFDSIESYALRPDGDIDNWFTCRKKSFEAPLERKASALAKVKDTTTNATWSVRFFKVIAVRYLVLELDPDYQWMAVGHPSRRYGWVMSRSKTLPDATYQQILGNLAKQGYDVTRFEKVPQREARTAANVH